MKKPSARRILISVAIISMTGFMLYSQLNKNPQVNLVPPPTDAVSQEASSLASKYENGFGDAKEVQTFLDSETERTGLSIKIFEKGGKALASSEAKDIIQNPNASRRFVTYPIRKQGELIGMIRVGGLSATQPLPTKTFTNPALKQTDKDKKPTE